MKIQHTILFLSFFVAGCATTKYTWKGYDTTLYRHYKNPDENEKFVMDLKEIIDAGEKKGNVPPGLYAEYGYTLYETKQYDEALVCFNKEYERWPESRVLMQKMIDKSKIALEKNK